MLVQLPLRIYFTNTFSVKNPRESDRRMQKWLRLLCVSIPLFLSFGDAKSEQISRDLEEQEEKAFKQAATQAAASLVRIETVGGLDQVQKFAVGNGPTTGLVLSADGYVISSSFNFISKPASIIVSLTDGRRLAAKVVASDTSRMLTLLKIEGSGLVPAQAAPKSAIKVGQWAIAVGRALDANAPNVSVGIVSALNRVWGKAIQTDAKISPVNYGGALVDVEGRVLGVLVPLSPTDNSPVAGVEWYDSGIGFAIPLENVLATLDRLKEGKDIRQGLAGFSFASQDLYEQEPKIDRVRYDSPIYHAGIKDGDVIAEVDGHKVSRSAQVRHVLGSKIEGDKLAISVKRGDQVLKSDITLVGELKPFEAGFLGVLPVREAIKEPLIGDKKRETGVGVRWVYPDSPAAKIGLKTRDRIVKFRDQAVTSATQLTDLVSRVRPTEKATLVIQREGKEQTHEVTLDTVINEIPSELPSSVIDSLPPEEKAKAKDVAEKATESKQDGKPVEEKERLRVGRFTEQIEESKNSYWAFVPDGYNPAFGYALAVWLHPPGDTLEATVYELWKSSCEQRGIILLGPKSADLATGWQPNEAEFVRETVANFQKKYSIDSGRIVLHGFSKSGPFATHLAFKHRDLFRGLVLAASPLTEPPPENLPEYRLQFHLICGGNDPIHPLIEQHVAGLKKLKFPISFTSEQEQDHRYPTAEAIESTARWIDLLDRF